MKNVAIIGCGLIGNKRAQHLAGARLIACADIMLHRAQALAQQHKDCAAYSDWRMPLTREDIDIVIVATTHHMLSEIALATLTSGKHLFLENNQCMEALFCIHACRV